MSATVLVVAGVDSSGGAGILRDAATAHEFGASIRVAVTAVTAQDDQGLRAVHHMPPDVVAAQIAACGPIGAVKIGMLGTAATIAAVAGSLPDAVPVVLDPVLSSTSGYCLLEPSGLLALATQLLPRIALLTPNLPELAAFATMFELPDDDEVAIVGALQRAGSPAVLVKGGHDGNPLQCEDRLYLRQGGMISFSSKRFPLPLRGTGCQLATGIAVQLARGDTMVAAIVAARRSVENRFMAAVDGERLSRFDQSNNQQTP